MQSEAMPRLPPRRAQRMQQRRQDARAGRADRMAERAGAAVHVDPRMIDIQVAHGRHGDGRERLIDLIQIARRLASSRVASSSLLDRAHGRGREPLRLVRVAGVRQDARQRLQPAVACRRCASSATSAAAPSEMEDELAAVTVPSLPNAGLRVGILLDVAGAGRLVAARPRSRPCGP